MNTVTLYKNANPYPYYSGSLSTYKIIQATPRHQDLRSGYIDIQLSLDEIFSFNYLSFNKSGKTVYAWVENVEHRSGNKLWRVHFTADAFRTYKNNLVLGTQYIERSPNPTLLEDPLLGSTQEYGTYTTVEYTMGSTPNKRYAVVQVKRSEGQTKSNTPGQPTPYRFYITDYEVNNWAASTPLNNLIEALSGFEAQTSNIITIYSVPYYQMSSTPDLLPLFVEVGGESIRVEGWQLIPENTSSYGKFTTFTEIGFPPEITKTSHSIKLIFPEAGIMNIPDEFLHLESTLRIRQDIDIFSGSCNYMLTTNSGLTPTHLSVRGGSLSTIPILSSPFETYISQNQNTMAIGLLGDVANLGVGVATGNPLSMIGGATGLINTAGSLADMKNAIPSNPPAYLGSALVSHFNQKFYMVIISKHYDNETEVRARYGYPQHRIGPLTIPSSGFIQTNNCSVSSDGSVPLWAINEINQLFNGGLLFK